MNSLGNSFSTLYTSYHPYTLHQKREKSFEKDRAVLWQKCQFGGQTSAAVRAAERSGGAGPIAGIYRKGMPIACSAAAERSGGQPGLLGLRPDHLAPGPALPDLAPNAHFCLPTALSPPSLYIPFSYLQPRQVNHYISC